jgi:iron(III) transport system ATP-binding protein
MLLQVSEVSKRADSNFILKQITFTQKKLQKIAVVGETGSGKSTLLKVIAGLEQPSEGEIVFDGTNVAGPDERLVPGHEKIAYLSQYYELPHALRIEQVLEYANRLSDEDAAELYAVCRIDHLLKRRTDQLSGGEGQRVAIARLLIAKPQLLLLDEPFSNLDTVHKNILKAVMEAITKKLKITCILISHDPEDTLSWADKILVMKDGEIVQKGLPEKVYRKPVDEYVAGLFGAYSILSPVQSNAFAHLLNVKTIKKDLIIRPESFKLTSKKTKALKGEIIQVNFYGSYYLVDVLLLETPVTVKTEFSALSEGETVYVTLDPACL